MAKAATKRKPKKKCCVSKPRCKRCPVRLKMVEAQRRDRKRKQKHR